MPAFEIKQGYRRDSKVDKQAHVIQHQFQQESCVFFKIWLQSREIWKMKVQDYHYCFKPNCKTRLSDCDSKFIQALVNDMWTEQIYFSEINWLQSLLFGSRITCSWLFPKGFIIHTCSSSFVQRSGDLLFFEYYVDPLDRRFPLLWVFCPRSSWYNWNW